MVNGDWSLQGRTVLITGANTGIGKATVLALAAQPARWILAGRSKTRTEPVVEQLRSQGVDAQFLSVDLASANSVREAAKDAVERFGTIDVLINNAGIGGQRGLTQDGFELHFGVNHLGPYLLTRLLLPALLRADRPRVVHLSSKLHRRIKAIDWSTVQKRTRTMTGVDEYGLSKLGNVVFAAGLAKRCPELLSYSVHPGVIASDIYRRIPAPIRFFLTRRMDSVEAGAQGPILLASAAQPGAPNGSYFHRTRLAEPSELAQDSQVIDDFWKKSAEWVGLPAELDM